MGICRDKSVTLLNRHGYNVVKLPRAGIEPLDLLGRDGRSMQWLGRLDQLWQSTRPVPQVLPPQVAAAIEGQTTSSLELSAGLTLLKGVLSAFGAGAGLQAAYKNASALEFSFSNVRSIAVSPIEIGAFLAQGSADVGNPVIDRFFIDDDTDGFVITEVLKSDRLNVTARSQSGQALDIEADQIKGVLGAEAGVAISDASNSAVTYTGPVAVTFGFKLLAIGLDEGRWHATGVGSDGSLAFGMDAEQAGNEAVLLRPGMITLPEKELA